MATRIREKAKVRCDSCFFASLTGDVGAAGPKPRLRDAAGDFVFVHPPVYFFMWIQYKAGCGPQVKRTAHGQPIGDFFTGHAA